MIFQKTTAQNGGFLLAEFIEAKTIVHFGRLNELTRALVELVETKMNKPIVHFEKLNEQNRL